MNSATFITGHPYLAWKQRVGFGLFDYFYCEINECGLGKFTLQLHKVINFVRIFVDLCLIHWLYLKDLDIDDCPVFVYLL